MDWTIPLVAGLYGLLIGSFLNVCSLRWPVDESVVHPRSRCPKCETLIVWYDNVPVFSWLLLRGQCRSCAAPVSPQYPMVEAATGLMWAAMFALHGPTWEALRGAVFLTIIFGISISDARFYIIPDEFSIGGTVIGLGMAFLPGGIDWLPAIIGAALGYGVLWFVGVAGTWIIKKMSPGRLEEAGVDHAMGGGDIKMMMMVGAFLGAWGVAFTIFLGSVLALVTVLARSIPAALARDEDGEMEMGRLIPFGVFLAGGGAISYVWGDAMVAWYVTSVLGMPM
jgi:leader peptidase (prepilin peptidase)/N-methyltransferase